jgi:hypothetical protein
LAARAAVSGGCAAEVLVLVHGATDLLIVACSPGGGLRRCRERGGRSAGAQVAPPVVLAAAVAAVAGRRPPQQRGALRAPGGNSRGARAQAPCQAPGRRLQHG